MSRRNPSLETRADDPYVDAWSPVHLAVGVLLGLLLPAFYALLVLALWEPFVLLVVAPRLKGTRGVLARTQLTGPTLRNVLTDLVFDVAGVALGAFVLRDLIGFGPLF